jgi:predicted RNA-binding protein associated with RNAse of E/G family
VRIYEVKRHLDGTEERYTLTLVRREPHVVVAEYRFKKSYVRDGFDIPRGSKTYGFFWRRRPYIMYRMIDPKGRNIADRYDVVRDVELGEREVAYTDVLLDVWVRPDGSTLVEDEDEVAEAARDGLLSRAEVREVERVRDLILRRHRAIEGEIGRLLR